MKPTDVKMRISVLEFEWGLGMGGLRRAPRIKSVSSGRVMNLRKGSGTSYFKIGGVLCGCFSMTASG